MSVVTTVLGAGAFGTALAKVLAEGGHQVILWGRDADVIESINGTQRHPRRLEGVRLPPGLQATTDLQGAMQGAKLVVSAVPTVAVRDLWGQAAPFLPAEALVLNAAKGIECDTLFLVSDVMCELLPTEVHPRLAYLSGPSFALEMARRLPTAVTVAASRAIAIPMVALFGCCRGSSTKRNVPPFSLRPHQAPKVLEGL